MTLPEAVQRSETGYGAASLLPNPYLFTLPRSLWARYKEFSYYTAEYLPLAASAAGQPFATNIDQSSHFAIFGAIATVRDTTNATILANVPQTVQIQDGGTNTNLFDRATDFMNVFGTAQQPNYWAMPRIIRAGSTLTTFLTNLEATARNVRLVYLGVRIYYSRNMEE